MSLRYTVIMSVMMLALSACGGDGDGGGGGGIDQVDWKTQPLAAGTYKLAFTAISTARLDAPISGIEVAVKLPAGLSVVTTNDGSGQIAVASIASDSAIEGSALVGRYSASTRTVYLYMMTTQDTYRGGRFLNLLFTVASGVSVTPNEIIALNAAYPHYAVFGLDDTTHSSVTMTGKVQTTLDVAR